MDCENKENLRKCNMSSTDPIEEFREDHRRVGDGLLDNEGQADRGLRGMSHE